MIDHSPLWITHRTGATLWKYRWLLILAVILNAFSVRSALASPAAVPRFETSVCPPSIDSVVIDSGAVRCGYLIVPEHHADPTGRTLRLAVAIAKSPAAHPAPDPVVFLAGGPGMSALKGLGSALDPAAITRLTGDRDLVLIEQRGTGYSDPALQCPAPGLPTTKFPSKPPTLTQEASQETSWVTACRNALVAKGVDLSAYTTEENALDIADLRTALGYSQINLDGASYGTRLALSVMRYAPQGIRSVILDSVYGPTVNTFTDPNRSAARLFHIVFGGCASVPSCASRYPHLESRFNSLVKQLDKHPVAVSPSIAGKQTRFWLTGELAVDATFDVLYDASSAFTVRYAVWRAAHGHYGPYALLIADYADSVSGDPSIMAEGMYLSVECSEDFPNTTEGDILTSEQALPPALRRDMGAVSLRRFHDCQIWNVPAVNAVQKQPVVSDIPTLILEGEDDPITPPAYGSEVGKTLSHSFFFEFPGTGHGVRWSDPCPYGMAAAFLDFPTTRPDDACIAQMMNP